MLMRTVLNTDKTLRYVPELITKDFGIPYVYRNNEVIGTCLVAQVAYALSTIVSIPAQTLARHITDRIGPPSDLPEAGWTLAEILKTFEQPVNIGRKSIRLNVSVHVYGTIEATVKAFVEGHPIIFMIPRAASYAMEIEGNSYEDGTAIATPIRPAEDDRYHSWLMVAAGNRTPEFKHDTIVLRDSRPEYAFKGYLRVAYPILCDYFSNVRAISLEV